MRSRTHVLIAFCSAMAVTMIAVSDMRRTSPGGLAAVHQRMDELAGKNDCSACHGGLFGTLREACLECHAPIAEQLAEARGLHGTLGARAEQCGLCHAEHHGAAAPLVHGQSFALAGVPKADAFDHRLLGFVLDGAHAPLECSECHANARVALLPEGETRFLGLERDCASCHEDPHEGRMASACASCHGQATWDGLLAPEHERFLPLIGPHALACSECHEPEGAHALEIVGGKGPRPLARECATCHESPHSAPFVAGIAARVQLAAGQACVSCHAADHATFHEQALDAMSPEQHAASGFALTPPHDAPACADCHAANAIDSGTNSARASPATQTDRGDAEDTESRGVRKGRSETNLDRPPRVSALSASPRSDRESSRASDFAARFPGRAPGQCSACHADVHAGQFEQGPFAGQECDACHDPLRFEPHLFDAEAHAVAALELTGQHLEAACEDCHEKPAEDEARVFRGTPSDCDACHLDAHAGFFTPFVERMSVDLGAEVEHGECARCHDATRFAAAEAGFDHEGFTGFAVRGAHKQSDCTSCHVPAAEPDDSGRTFGRVAEHFGAFAGCVSCHADPHGGLFDEQTGSPIARERGTVEGQTDCARCHVESSFRKLRRDFDHGYWTGFALAGAHAAARCAACHAPLAAESSAGRTTATAPGAGCADCHEDPHARQFADEFGTSDCARCHVSDNENFLAFDHERDARFALGEAHDQLDCAVCHPTETRGRLAFVRFRPLGSECTDCHGSNAEVLLRRQPRR